MLVDGTCVVYRAYYAIRELSTSAGQPTNAVFGFVRMLQQALEAWKPTHTVVVFDGGLPEERTELLADYKADRPSRPDDMIPQFDTIETFLDLSDILWDVWEGHEADDLLSCGSLWAEANGADAVGIMTSDKDMFQLVNDRVEILPVAGKSPPMRADGVIAKTGVPPGQIVPWLALVGDAADNIPGVPGVGPKTAARLLTQFGSLEALWKRLDEVKGDKIRAALAESREIVDRNLQLVQLRQDLVWPHEWEDARMAKPDISGLISFFESLEFDSMAKALREPDLF